MQTKGRALTRSWLRNIQAAKELPENYDFKRLLLGTNYDENEPIKNILLAKDFRNYVDKQGDYRFGARWPSVRGHLENYAIVVELLSILGCESLAPQYDVMNSFWTTYKFYLQVMYPAIFMPDGLLSGELPLSLPKQPSQNSPAPGYPPHISSRHALVPDKYVTYYQRELKHLDLSITQGDRWLDFLLANFDQFARVNKSPALQVFAQKTHTIGNMAPVPEGFNSRRGAYDYWDRGLEKLKQDFRSAEEWDFYVEANYFGQYIKEGPEGAGEIAELWARYPHSPSPSTEEQILEFLEAVSPRITTRGQQIIEQYTAMRQYDSRRETF